jgi:hypothetical protein
MKSYVHIWHYLAELFLEREMFQTKFVKENQTLYVQQIYFLFWKIVPFIR